MEHDTCSTTIRDLQWVYKYTYRILPIVAGVNNFSNSRTLWPEFLASGMSNLLSLSTEALESRGRDLRPAIDPNEGWRHYRSGVIGTNVEMN